MSVAFEGKNENLKWLLLKDGIEYIANKTLTSEQKIKLIQTTVVSFNATTRQLSLSSSGEEIIREWLNSPNTLKNLITSNYDRVAVKGG